MYARKTIKYILVALFVASIAGYIYSRSRTFVSGPHIEITSPQNGSSVENPLIEVKGIARNISRIELNNGQIFVDENGHFEEKLLLPQGHTIILLEAEDKFNRTTSEILEIFYSQTESFSKENEDGFIEPTEDKLQQDTSTDEVTTTEE